MSAIYHITMCILRRLGKRRLHRLLAKGTPSNQDKQYSLFSIGLNQKQASFLAGALSALPLAFGFNAQEQNLLKLFIYPLAYRCVCDKLFELGWLPQVKYGSVISYMMVSSVITYGFTVERHSQPPSMYRMVDSYARLNDVENRFLNAFKTLIRVQITEKYF